MEKITFWDIDYSPSDFSKISKITFRWNSQTWIIIKHGDSEYHLLSDNSNTLLSDNSNTMFGFKFSICGNVINSVTDLKHRIQKILNLYNKLLIMEKIHMRPKYISAIIERIFYKLSGLTTEEIGVLNLYYHQKDLFVDNYQRKDE